MSGSRNIFAKVGSAPDLSTKEPESDSENDDQELEGEEKDNSSGRVMNMKQEGPFLVPQMGWMKDNLNLDNLTSDFLESNVTGEVMNLDDFLKELQVNELAEGANMAPPASAPSPGQMAPSPLRLTPAPHGHGGHQGPGQDDRFHNLIRPANIENLREHLASGQSHGPAAMSRPSIMHHVGKPPDLSIKYPGEHQGGLGGTGAMPPISLPYRDAMQQSSHLLSPPLKDGHSHPMPGHHLSPGSHGQTQGGPAIPQASVRPLVRQAKHEPMDPDIKPPVQRRKRQLSECSNLTEDEDEDGEGEEGGMGNFTSTVCVNFSEDDLRLATIPGQDFDPTTRRFSEEELKPQPIIRKRKKQFVPDELKNNKYWAKRYKNNEAAKRSREARRLKENQIAMRARFLEEENNALKGEVDVLKKENSDLKQMMMALEEKFNKFSNTC